MALKILTHAGIVKAMEKTFDKNLTDLSPGAALMTMIQAADSTNMFGDFQVLPASSIPADWTAHKSEFHWEDAYEVIPFLHLLKRLQLLKSFSCENIFRYDHPIDERTYKEVTVWT